MSKKNKKLPACLPDIDKISFLILDIDGVMTQGNITYTESGEEVKTFDVKDGQGIKYWTRCGLRAGIITGRTSPIVRRRAEELDIGYVAMRALDKLPAMEKMLAEAGVGPENVVMIGDDLPDIPLIRRVGLGVAVADAVQEVKDAAGYVTKNRGGRGAVREIIEYVLKSQGKWDSIMERYLA